MTTPRPPIAEPSSPRRIGMGATNRREILVVAKGSMPATFSPRETATLPRAVTPRERTMMRSVRGVPSELSHNEQEMLDTVASSRRETAQMANMSDCLPFKSLRPSEKFVRPTVLEVGPKEASTGTDLVRPDKPLPSFRANTSAAEDDAGPRRDRIVHQRMRKQNADIGSVKSKTVDGHSEAALAVMREFFQNRPLSALMDVLRDMDTDFSGTIDEQEFKGGMKKLNMELSDRDVHAVFKTADKDGSGEIDIDEFFNCFRSDAFPRDTFFWSKTRPRGHLNREERVEMARTLGAGGFRRDLTSKEILSVVQSKVDQFNAKTVFNSLDDNRSGRVSVRELVGALREMEILVPDSKAEELIAELNGRVGDGQKSSHLTYRSFANQFIKNTMTDGTTGQTEIALGRMSDQPELSVTHEGVWHASVPGESLAPSSLRKLPKVAAESDNLDSVQRMHQLTPRPITLSTLPKDRGKVYEEEAKNWVEGKRHDMMSEWRGKDGNLGDETGTAGDLGRNIDWNAYKTDPQQMAAHPLFARDPKELTKAQFGESTLPPARGAPPSGSQSARAALPAPSSPRARKLRETMADVMLPAYGTPGYVDEAERVSPRPGMWCCPDSLALQRKKAARQELFTTRRAEREATMRAYQDRQDDRLRELDDAKSHVQTSHFRRSADWQQLVESKIAEVGRRAVVLEPPSTDDPNWAPAPPHRMSHWDTIAGHHKDPPSRVHVKMITSYRRAFPEADNRPLTPRRPQWGGDRPNAVGNASITATM